MADYGFHRGVQTNGPGTGKTIAERRLEAALAEANEKVARVQDLPEESRTRQAAELDRDELLETQARVGNKLMDPSEGPLHVTRLPNSVGPGEYPPFVPMPNVGTLFPTTQETTMTVYIIWAMLPDLPESPWAVAVWDDDSLIENEDGYLRDLAKAEEEYGARYVRVTKTTVNWDAVVEAFKPVSI